jgi:glycosyltransferase involved in cell wall biosynthesis
MPQPIEFSVVIPMFNGARWIDEQLNALAKQVTDVSWEVIVADNGSTDSGAAIVRSRVASFPVPLKLVDASQTRGVAFARNTGASAASGNSIGFCDCDDHVSTGWVDAAAEALRNYDVVCGPRRRIGSLHDQLEWPPQTSFGPLLLGNNYGLTRRAYNALGDQDESLPPYGGEDIDLTIRVSEMNLNVSVVPQMLVNFREEGSRLVALRKVYSASLAEVAIWYKHEARFREKRGLLRAIGNLTLTPFEMLRSKSIRKAMRCLVRRYAHVVGQISPNFEATNQRLI